MFLNEVDTLYVINPKVGRKEVLFWGIGEVAHLLYRQCVSAGRFDCIGFYDANPKGRKTCFGLKVFTRAEFEALDRSTPIVLATKRPEIFHEMTLDAYRLGFTTIISLIGYMSLPVQYDLGSTEIQLGQNRAGMHPFGG